jgi:hypothetical protein
VKKTILYQRSEAGFIFLASLYFYHHLHFSLLLFIVLFFTVDIFMVGYITNNNIGAQIYNFGHSFIVSTLLILIGVMVKSDVLIGGGLIWTAHIGFDRALGYGLKFDSGFNDTHLGKIGKK